MKPQILLALSCVALLPACAGYKAQSLARLQPRQSVTLEDEQVLFDSHVLNKHECEKYLGANVLQAGYVPIQIAIRNQTERSLMFSPDDISLKTVPAEIVAESVHDKTTNRIFGWGIPGLFIPIFLIPAVVDSVWSVEANKKMDNDYWNKEAQERILNPNAEVQGLIFVAKQDFSKHFDVILTDIHSNERIVCNAHACNSPLQPV